MHLAQNPLFLRGHFQERIQSIGYLKNVIFTKKVIHPSTQRLYLC